MTDLEICKNAIDVCGSSNTSIQSCWNTIWPRLAPHYGEEGRERAERFVRTALECNSKFSLKKAVEDILNSEKIAEREKKAEEENARRVVEIARHIKENGIRLTTAVLVTLGIRKGDRITVRTADGSDLLLHLAHLPLPEREEATDDDD